MRLLFTNDLYLLTITCRPSRSFFLFTFLFYFLYMFTKTIHMWSFTRKTFLCTSIFLYMTNCFYTRIRTLLFYVTRSIYRPYLHSKIFSFFPTRTYGSHKSSFIYTCYLHTQEFLSTHHLHKKPSIHIFLSHTCINKKPFSFLYEHDFYSQRIFLFIRIFGSFYF